MFLKLLLSLLFGIIPTVAAWRWCTPLLIHLKSRLLRLCIAFSLGQFVLTVITLLSASYIWPGTASPILSGSISAASLLLVSAIFSPFIKLPLREPDEALSTLAKDVMIAAGAFLVSYYFFSQHLIYSEGLIFTSQVYWDFGYQAALIQSFSIGGNFPPTNEMISGTPLFYHYMYFLLTSIYCSQLGLVSGIVLVSAVGFSLMLIAMIAVSEELFDSKAAGILACGFTLTSGSLFFVDFLSGENPLEKFFPDPLPLAYHVSFSRHDSIAYNGSMFNIFYFMAERQLVCACLLMLFAAVLLAKRSRIPWPVLFTAGAVYGACVNWHLFGIVAVFGGALLVQVFGENRRQTLAFTVPFAILFFVQTMALKFGDRPDIFLPAMFDVPRFDYTFASNKLRGLAALPRILSFWGYAFGIKLLVFPIAFILLKRKAPAACAAFCALMATAFILTNTIQLSAVSIYENHKWERPMFVLLDVFCAATLFLILTSPGKLRRLAALTAILLCFPSGIIENIGYFRTQAQIPFARYPSEVSTWLEGETVRGSTVVSDSPRDIVLAGRRLYVPNMARYGGAFRADLVFTNLERRQLLGRALKLTPSREQFCRVARSEEIDYVEFFLNSYQPLPWHSLNSNCFSQKLLSTRGEIVRYLAVSCVCGLSPNSSVSK